MFSVFQENPHALASYSKSYPTVIPQELIPQEFPQPQTLKPRS